MIIIKNRWTDDTMLTVDALDLRWANLNGANLYGADLSGVDRIYLELHDHVTGLDGVRRVFTTMAAQGFAFDPRHSSGPIVLFRRSL